MWARGERWLGEVSWISITLRISTSPWCLWVQFVFVPIDYVLPPHLFSIVQCGLCLTTFLHCAFSNESSKCFRRGCIISSPQTAKLSHQQAECMSSHFSIVQPGLCWTTFFQWTLLDNFFFQPGLCWTTFSTLLCWTRCNAPIFLLSDPLDQGSCLPCTFCTLHCISPHSSCPRYICLLQYTALDTSAHNTLVTSAYNTLDNRHCICQHYSCP